MIRGQCDWIIYIVTEIWLIRCLSHSFIFRCHMSILEFRMQSNCPNFRGKANTEGVLCGAFFSFFLVESALNGTEVVIFYKILQKTFFTFFTPPCILLCLPIKMFYCHAHKRMDFQFLPKIVSVWVNAKSFTTCFAILVKPTGSRGAVAEA